MAIPDDYEYEYEHRGKTVRLGVHHSGVAHEPRVCWQVGNRSGECGYITMDAPEPVVRLEEGETVRLGDRLVTTISVPHDIGEPLAAECEKQGMVVAESDRIGTDPTTFPAEIADFKRIGWESTRNVMWYWRDEQANPRAYQIEDSELVFRAQEWADEASSKEELIDTYTLDRQ